jgi:hypothetical protein
LSVEPENTTEECGDVKNEPINNIIYNDDNEQQAGEHADEQHADEQHADESINNTIDNDKNEQRT